MGVEDSDACFLDQFIVHGIDVFKGPPANAQERVIGCHLQGSQPHVHAHRYRGVSCALAKNREQTPSNAAMMEGQH